MSMAPSNKVRIFVDAHVFDGEYQGTRTFIKGIYELLSKKQNILLYLGAYDIGGLKRDFQDNRRINFIKYRSKSALIRLSYDIPDIIRTYKIDYAHFQYIVPPYKNCKFIVTTHDLLFNEYPEEFSLGYRLTKNFLFKRSALRSDIITTVSEYSKKSIYKYFGVNPQDIVVTPNGVADVFFQKHNKQESANFIYEKYGISNFILYVSRIERRKNHILLVKAFLELELYKQDYHLVLLGHQSIKVPELDKKMN